MWINESQISKTKIKIGKKKRNNFRFFINFESAEFFKISNVINVMRVSETVLLTMPIHPIKIFRVSLRLLLRRPLPTHPIQPQMEMVQVERFLLYSIMLP